MIYVISTISSENILNFSEPTFPLAHLSSTVNIVGMVYEINTYLLKYPHCLTLLKELERSAVHLIISLFQISAWLLRTKETTLSNSPEYRCGREILLLWFARKLDSEKPK